MRSESSRSWAVSAMGVICGDIVVLLVGGPREAPRVDAGVITGML